MPRIPQSIIHRSPVPNLRFDLSAEYQRRRFPVCFYCSFVEKVLKLHITASEDCYYTGIVKNQ